MKIRKTFEGIAASLIALCLALGVTVSTASPLVAYAESTARSGFNTGEANDGTAKSGTSVEHGDDGGEEMSSAPDTESSKETESTADESAPSPYGDVEYYGRAALATLENATELLFAYDALVAGVEACREEITVYNGHDELTKDELTVAWDAYLRDHTEHFWLGNTYSYAHRGGGVITVKPKYLMSGDELEAARVDFEAAADAITVSLKSGMTEYERELALHDLLAAKVSYVDDAPNAHNAYGALVEGRAVCEGYAEAFQYLLRRVGIQSFIITGESDDPKTGESVGHAWNAVRIDGSFYHVDLTWNDQEGFLYHSYFNLPNSEILRDHVIGEAGFPLPVCNSDAKSYFKINSARRITAPYSAKGIAAMLSANAMRVSVLADDPAALVAFVQNNIDGIAGELGVRGTYTYGLANSGGEVLIFLSACPHTDLTRVGAKAPTCTENGNVEYYVCTCGSLFSDSKGENMIFSKDSLTVVSPGHDWSVKHKDAEHLRSEPETCAERDTYWYDCAECGITSATLYFSGDRTGDHSRGTEMGHDLNSHWTRCLYCDEKHYDEDNHTLDGLTCTVCGYVVLGEIGETLEDLGENADVGKIVLWSVIAAAALVVLSAVWMVIRRR